ncbi:hypothetical protein B7P33_12690 [Sediminicola luteus]|uniref:Histidine kinase n=2 Tax=Sediminicola luteus TaxID=319238 RepID=A0A2A4G8K3_9FLAO|nr:hypothetical protein B7P33_12690 [Sediminicola luteus]
MQYMEIYQHNLTQQQDIDDIKIGFRPDVCFLFVSPDFQGYNKLHEKLTDKFPGAEFIGCSTAGEILDNQVHDTSIALTAVRFNRTRLKIITESLEAYEGDSFKIGQQVTDRLKRPDLKHILLFSDGLNINGGELVRGLRAQAPPLTTVTGALAADGTRFNNTFVITKAGAQFKTLVALGLYSNHLNVGFGSHSGWDSFGIERLVTRSETNKLYELDGKPALALYKSFLGEQAKNLPGSALLFPLSMRDEAGKRPVIRTILGINEEEQSLTFAGNIPQRSYVRLMKANTDRLIQGAAKSAEVAKENGHSEPQLAFLFSCVGRKMVMDQLVEEEVEAVKEVFGNVAKTTGFYSYGEIAPFDKESPCDLHNQTMSITTISED